MVIGHSVRHVPYYRNLFAERSLRIEDIASVDDLGRLSRLSREAVRTGGSEFHADNANRFGASVVHTSGTSGLPLECHLDRESNVLEFVHYWRHWGWAGYRLGDRFAELASIYFLPAPS